eukprot:scaffold22681_cov146-Cylindrotheca_fusiformis.AAC.10
MGKSNCRRLMKLVCMMALPLSSFAFLPWHFGLGRWTYSPTTVSSLSNPAKADSKIGKISINGTLSNAIVRVSFDGTRFTGWSAANTNGNEKLQRPAKRRRRRGAMGQTPRNSGFVRSVEGVLRDNLAKIYGNVDPKRIIVEGCSRTDRGVHAQGMVAQIYCLTEEAFQELGSDEIESVIPGKRIPHPTSAVDTTYFEPMPMGGSLSRLAFALNRMRPPDIQVTGIAPTPSNMNSNLPFHASKSSRSKTYEYRISVGDFQDPTMRRLAWYVPDTSLNIEMINIACSMVEGTHDFTAFQGSPRGGGERKRREAKARSTVCTLFKVYMIKEDPPINEVYFPGLKVETYKIVIVGDRFLYKMNRFIVGSLVALGRGVLELGDLQRALTNGNWNIPGQEDSRKQFTCAPPHGLVLKSIDYNDMPIDWQPLRF